MKRIEQIHRQLLDRGIELELVEQPGVQMLAKSLAFPGVQGDNQQLPEPLLGITIEEYTSFAPLAGKHIGHLTAQICYADKQEGYEELLEFTTILNPLLICGSIAVCKNYPVPGWNLTFRHDVVFTDVQLDCATEQFAGAIAVLECYMQDLYPRLVRLATRKSSASEEIEKMFGA